MEIDYLLINDKKFQFDVGTTLIYSRKNSHGKTSLIRLVLYALGYPIPSTKGIDFSKLSLEIGIIQRNQEMVLKRHDKIINIEMGQSVRTYKLPEDFTEVLASVFETENPKLADNLLGLIYFDQDKGWTLLNRGIVIGKIRFKIEELLDGISNTDAEKIQIEMDSKKEERKVLLQIKTLLTLNMESEKNKDDINWSSIDELQDQIRSIDMDINKKKLKISKLDRIIKSNDSFYKLIDDMNILIKVDNKAIPVSKKNILGFDFNQTVITAQIARENRELSEYIVQKNKMSKDLNKQLSLFSDQDQIRRFNNAVEKINITQDSMESTLKENTKEINKLKSLQRDSLGSIQQVRKIYNTIVKFSKILGVQDTIDKDEDFIFTRDLKRYSGAKLHLLVFAYRMAVLKVVQNQDDKIFPIIVDSPMAGEVDAENIQRMFKLLDQEFPNNQKIFASIYEYNRKWDTKIVLNEGLMDGVSNLNEGLSENNTTTNPD
ncbi:hypothetical protein [Levilactobacillus yonginensis]|uniref:hypothetical protein n=1 Tax=Levilactobacillus yonginensis TaxID=1054041 RepID=UPI00345DB48A